MASFQERKVRLSLELCACGSGRFKIGPRECTNGRNGRLGGRDQGCYAMNQSELSSPRDAAMAALNTRMRSAARWDSCCHATRVHAAAWETLLRERSDVSQREDKYGNGHRVGVRYAALCTAQHLLSGQPALGMTAKQILARWHRPPSDGAQHQLLVDFHRAILLDNVPGFLAAAAQHPALLLSMVETGRSGAYLSLPASAAGVVIHPQVQRYVYIRPANAYPRVSHTLWDLFRKVQPVAVLHHLPHLATADIAFSIPRVHPWHLRVTDQDPANIYDSDEDYDSDDVD